MSAIAPELLVQLRAAIARGDESEALRLADVVLAGEPGHEATLVWLSARARQRGAFDEAVALARRGLAVHPRSAALHLQLGAALADAGDDAAAEASLQDVPEHAPTHLFAQLWLGHVQARRGAREAGLRTRAHALAAAERRGLLAAEARVPADVRVQLDAAMAALREARAAVLAQALDGLSVPAQERARVEAAFARHLGQPGPMPAHPLQQPAFLFVPGLDERPWWPRDAFPFLAALEARTDAIRAELLAVLAGDAGFAPYIDMPADAPAAATWSALNRSPAWTGYHFFRHGERVGEHCARCPHTAAALDALPLLRIPGHAPEALFSVLRPRTHIPPHTGVINGRLTVHLPLLVPADCGALAVAREARTWHEGECLVFDDSFVHEAINRSGQTRAVLIFDLWHPGLPEAARAALAAAIAAYGAFNRALGLDDPMRE
ncbi:MAG TPA: aspartyl/asparaginyl beta-hydroxylase domain-containing protein [Xanthomonadaceae bacterium]|nr:aspartyl/asparaginyl beta-hydroxylase domain-containing protein [Xanthomonadaceae bacterium]